MPIDHEKLKKRRAGSRAGTGWRPREGSNRVRFLPPNSAVLDNWDLLEDLSVQYKMHFFRIEGRPIEVSRCLEGIGGRCPACAVWRLHRKSPDPGLKEMASKVAPADQYLFNVLDLNNIASGIQSYAANYTVWDKVMEVAANPAWGNIVDPADGVDFEISLTPGSRSRSGFNAYSVTPSPTRTTVIEGILDGIEDWQAQLDSLPDNITEAKTPEEITALLNEMGFPPLGGVAHAPTAEAPRPAPAASAPRPAAAAPRPAAAAPRPAPAASAPRPAAAAPRPAPATSAPRPAVARAAAVSVPGAPRPAASQRQVEAQEEGGYDEPDSAPSAPALAAPRGGNATASGRAPLPHYDPGPQYVNPNEGRVEMPDGAPRCFSDYDTERHECQPCPFLIDCQFQLLTLD